MQAQKPLGQSIGMIALFVLACAACVGIIFMS
jgi:hypothetical protein